MAGRLYVSRPVEIRQPDRRLPVAPRTAVVLTEVNSTAVWLSAAHRTVGRLTVVRMIAAVRQHLFDFCRVSAFARFLLSGRYPLRHFRFATSASLLVIHRLCFTVSASLLPLYRFRQAGRVSPFLIDSSRLTIADGPFLFDRCWV